MGRPRTTLPALTVPLAASVTAGVAVVVLRRQAAIARRRIGKALGEEVPDADRVWRARYPGDPLELLVLGDSVAAGLGAERRKDTLGARIARGAAQQLQRPVRLRCAAVVGAESSALRTQLDGLDDDYRPDVAVVVVGGNDVTHRVPVATSVRHLVETVERLQERGSAVVVGTCPDLGALRPVPQPLRALGSRASRQLAAAQSVAARRAGAHTVSLAAVVGPFFVSSPQEAFSLDRFHPSALGYRRTAAALVPSVLVALGERAELPPGHRPPDPLAGTARRRWRRPA
ncbi:MULTISPECIES: SGNH/GDSL hydrolase family protein [unclassified Isoptericola]|uniref:SGNH/GDSL hydrolase family protein n=1 Tax=unclassified Isoptericola TaxID=2623355 RepID=UPI00271443F5|nr:MULTISPECIES: SGNH/GDSL hydrolase family protein [unclassified Isoptericola]MDO8148765.1 SGNH/GDSL hydrolase family protein [Isoptericola sp. b515]MDO8151294.1 SGNH/GDSL hydrolase family protein [Isoptericola sp. b408]